LADVLDIGADHFIEEPAALGELEDALMQYAGPPRDRGRSRELDDDERGRFGRQPRSTEPPARGRTERLDERARPERGKALGELHRTLNRLEAQLRSDDHRSDPELAELGLDGIPDVDPPDEPLADEDPLVTEVDDQLLGPAKPARTQAEGRARAKSDERGDDRPRRPSSSRFDDERPRPRPLRRDSTARLDRLDPDEDTGPGRRSWRDDPRPARTQAEDRARAKPDEHGDDLEDDSGRSDHTRPWLRPDSEGPL